VRLSGWARRGVLALVVVAVTGLPGVGHAAPDPKTAAKKLVVEGAQLVKRGDYEAALVRFKAAFDLVPSPKIQYNLGIAYMGLERNAEAFEAFQAFLADASEATTETITKARLYKESLLLKVCRLTVHSDVEGATITLDGRPRGTTPPAGEIMVDAGNHSLVVAKEGVGTAFTKWFDANPGSTLTIDANLLPPAPPPRPVLAARDPATRDPDLTAAPKPAPTSRRWAKVAGYTTGGLAIAALGFGTFELVINQLRWDDFNHHGGCDTSAPNSGLDGCESLLNKGAHAKTLSIVGYATAGILGGASTIFLLVGRNPSSGASEEVSVACAPSLTLPGAGCRLTF
jgi:PEGA domain